MSTITKPNTFTAGAVIVASEHNANFDTIYNDYNGNITDVNISASAAIQNSKLNLASISQTIALASVAINFAKGSDIASATTTSIGSASGNSVDVTGSTTITSFGTGQAGIIRFVRFTGAPLLTYDATALILPTSANIQAAAGDTATFESLGSGNWLCLDYQRKDGTALIGATVSNALSGSIIQTVRTSYSTFANLGNNGAVPLDDTIPTWAEGNEVAGLATTITPNNSSNILEIQAVGYFSSAGSGLRDGVFSVFQDPSGTDPAKMTSAQLGALDAASMSPLRLTYLMTAGTTSATTFKFRVGDSGNSNPFVINGKAASTAGRLYGGAIISTVIIREIKA